RQDHAGVPLRLVGEEVGQPAVVGARAGQAQLVRHLARRGGAVAHAAAEGRADRLRRVAAGVREDDLGGHAVAVQLARPHLGVPDAAAAAALHSLGGVEDLAGGLPPDVGLAAAPDLFDRALVLPA